MDVDLLKSGVPDNPPISVAFSDCRFLFLSIVVLEIISPFILNFEINSIILLIFFSTRSGEIFISIGFCIFLLFTTD